ncbi:MAG: class I lanthipeptide [Acidobacteria bacterium]|nr:class I lanthipeptide [Acidobacteriota bacterium]
MKIKKLNKKLGLSKITISNLNLDELLKVRGGQAPVTWTDGETYCDYGCYETYICETLSCTHQTFGNTCDTWCQ